LEEEKNLEEDPFKSFLNLEFSPEKKESLEFTQEEKDNFKIPELDNLEINTLNLDILET
jgi:hypothetical protein